MSHMVIYRGSDGKPGYHQADELSSAIKYVEHLRNDEGVDRARIFRMEEVSFEFRPYYKVEIGLGASAPGASGDMSTLPPPPSVEWTATRPAEGETSASEPDEAPEVAADVPSWADMPAANDDAGDGESAGHDGVAAGVGNRRGLFGR